MAFESIKMIAQAEEDAGAKVSEAASAVQRKLAEERKNYEAYFAAKTAEYEKKAAELVNNAQIAAEKKAEELLENTASKCAVMTVRAENKYDDAVSFITGKVVGV